MSTLEDLGIPALSDMSQDEAIEHLRTIRLSRRVPLKKAKSTVIKKAKAKAIPKLSQSQAENLLKLLEG